MHYSYPQRFFSTFTHLLFTAMPDRTRRTRRSLSGISLIVFLMFSPLIVGCQDAAMPELDANPNPHLVTYEGTEGPGVGKHIVFLAGDHEYRSEEILPAMARILAKQYGFKTSVFFTLDDEGFIEPGS